MTDLQIGLVGLGVVVIGGTMAYNKWQEVRHRKLAESMLKPQQQGDALFDGPVATRSEAEGDAVVAERLEPSLATPVETAMPERKEPVLNVADTAAVDEADLLLEEDSTPAPERASTAPTAPAADLSAWDDTPQDEPEETCDDESPAALPVAPLAPLNLPPVPSVLLDPAIDFVAAIALLEAAPGYRICHAQRETLSRINKPVRWVGYNEKLREWELFSVASEQEYRHLRIGLQVADRRGPVSEADHTLFVTLVRDLADDLMAVADMDDSRVLEKALQVDRFCAEVDLEIGVNLVSRGAPFSGTKLRALAEAAGLALGEDGLFNRRDDDGNVLFSLQNMESSLFSSDTIRSMSTHGVTFLIDVPRVDHGDRVFAQMVDLARRFGEALQGALVDDNRNPLSEAQLEHIRREYVAKPQAVMAQRGLPAGGPQALRLFA